MVKASALSLSNNILVRSRSENIKVTPMKLQKLLYYVCVKYAKQTGASPLRERFETWPYGPVLPSVYSEFKVYGSSPIKNFACDAAGKARMVDEEANPILSSCIDYVWDRLKIFDGVELSQRTHRRESGWYDAYQKNNDIISDEEMVNDGTI